MEILASRVLFEPADLDRSLAFYEGVLGLHRFREFGSPPYRGVVFFLGGGYLELTEGGEDAPTVPAGLRLWLQVRDVEDAVTQLRGSEHCTLEAEPERKPWGLIEATVRDPDGLALVLVEVPPDHPMRRDHRGTDGHPQA